MAEPIVVNDIPGVGWDCEVTGRLDEQIEQVWFNLCGFDGWGVLGIGC